MAAEADATDGPGQQKATAVSLAEAPRLEEGQTQAGAESEENTIADPETPALWVRDERASHDVGMTSEQHGCESGQPQMKRVSLEILSATPAEPETQKMTQTEGPEEESTTEGQQQEHPAPLTSQALQSSAPPLGVAAEVTAQLDKLGLQPPEASASGFAFYGFQV